MCVYICQKVHHLKRTENQFSKHMCKRSYEIAKTVAHGSILGRNRFGTKIEKLNKQMCLATIGFGCWPLTPS